MELVKVELLVLGLNTQCSGDVATNIIRLIRKQAVLSLESTVDAYARPGRVLLPVMSDRIEEDTSDLLCNLCLPPKKS